ncbi:transglutaminase domain-containing protein [Candidatus Woesearchaeota archaeon]|nr:transglutaminase domain-containing protein [Candidatus Woesearchaeota archaeon]
MNRRLFLGITGGSAAVLAGGGAVLWALSDDDFSKEASRLRKQWEPVLNLEGKILSNEILNSYPVIRKASKEKKLSPTEVEKRKKEFEEFSYTLDPSKYTESLFHDFFLHAIRYRESYLNPYIVAQAFGVDSQHYVANQVNRARSKSVDIMTERVLISSLAIVQERIDYPGMDTPDKGLEQLLSKVNRGEGDCTEFSYCTANIYYRMSNMLQRLDLFDRVRVTYGLLINKKTRYGKKEHIWVEYLKGKKWNAIEPTADQFSHGDYIRINQVGLPAPDPNNSFYLPFISHRILRDGSRSFTRETYAHVLPEKDRR